MKESFSYQFKGREISGQRALGSLFIVMAVIFITRIIADDVEPSAVERTWIISAVLIITGIVLFFAKRVRRRKTKQLPFVKRKGDEQ